MQSLLKCSVVAMLTTKWTKHKYILQMMAENLYVLVLMKAVTISGANRKQSTCVTKKPTFV